MENPSACVNLAMLSPSDNLYVRCRKLGSFGALLVPNPAPLTPVNQLKVRVADSVVDLGDGGVTGVVIWCNITTNINKLRKLLGSLS
jgi:hypothetical protein